MALEDLPEAIHEEEVEEGGSKKHLVQAMVHGEVRDYPHEDQGEEEEAGDDLDKKNEEEERVKDSEDPDFEELIQEEIPTTLIKVKVCNTSSR